MPHRHLQQSAAICTTQRGSCVTWEHQVANLNDSLRPVSNPRGKVCEHACMPSARDRVASCSFSHEPLRFPRPISPLGLAIRRYGIMPFSTGGPCPPAMRRWGKRNHCCRRCKPRLEIRTWMFDGFSSNPLVRGQWHQDCVEKVTRPVIRYLVGG